MAGTRSNQEWVLALSDQQQDPAAISELRDLLLRAALYTLINYHQDIHALEDHERLSLAEDCAQDALQAVMAQVPEFRGDSKFTTWAYKFAVNIALTRARKERWKAVSLDALSEDDDGQDWLQWQEQLQTSGSEMPALQAEVIGVIQAVIRTELTSRQRQVLKWMAFDGVPMDVVVERTGSNRNAVYKLLHDARLKVKRQLAAHGYELEEIFDLFAERKAIL